MLSLRQLIETGLLTLRRPREGGAVVLRWPFPEGSIWPLVLLSVVLSALVAELNSALNPPAPGVPTVYVAPFQLAIMLGSINISMAWAVYVIGRMFGGQGRFRAALILMTWQQFLWFGVLFVLTLVGLAIPGLAAMLSIGFGIWMIWILLSFIVVLHGFEIGVAVITLIMGSVVGVAVMILLLTLLGIGSPGGPA